MANSTDDAEKNQQDEDNFGLPDLEFKTLDQLQEQPKPDEEPVPDAEETATTTPAEEQVDHTPVYEEEESERRSSAPLVISIIIGLVVVIGSILIYQFVYKPGQEKARLAQLEKEKQAADRKAEEENQAKLAEQERLKKEAAATAKPADGSIETLGQRTGHYFVIIASSIDGDLVMDQAKKLSAKGIGSKIIPPFGKWKFYRLGIGDFDSFGNAQQSADASKADYGDGIWVMKY